MLTCLVLNGGPGHQDPSIHRLNLRGLLQSQSEKPIIERQQQANRALDWEPRMSVSAMPSSSQLPQCFILSLLEQRFLFNLLIVTYYYYVVCSNSTLIALLLLVMHMLLVESSD